MMITSQAHRWSRYAASVTIAVVLLTGFNSTVAHEPSDGVVTALNQAYEQGAKMVQFVDMPTDQAGARVVYLVYGNTLNSTFYTIGTAGVFVGEDIGLTATCGCEWSSYTARVDGGGTIFAFVGLLDDCASDRGALIVGTDWIVFDIPDGGLIDSTVPLSATPLLVDRNLLGVGSDVLGLIVPGRRAGIV